MSPSLAERLDAALTGRYRVERQLGEGGMATVHLAEDLRHQRQVALKVLRPELAAVVGAERFLAEIRTTANLQHPHILPLFDSGEADGFLFYVMPYVEGDSLRDRLDREHQLPVDDAVRIATDMAQALDYAHRQGVIHRDIKPANVLLLDGAPVISDFGIALAVGAAGGGRLTETGLSLGTPHYMSPEQASGDARIGPAADVYALGCVLYEMLVGEAPFTGSTPQAVLGRIITGSADRVSEHRKAVPTNVSDAVEKALEKLPADRFRNAGEMADALGDPAYRYGVRVGSGADPASAGRWKALATTTTLLFLGATTVAAWSLTRSAPPEPVARFPSPFLEDQFPVGPMKMTRDGAALVYTGLDAADAGTRLWVRRWRDLSANPLPGTEGARQTALGQVSLSPDQREVAFTTGNPGALRVVPLDGGPARTLVEAASAAGDWSDDGWIYFQVVGTAIQRIPARGGTPQTLTERREGEMFHTLPALLPGDRTLLFQVFRAGNGSDAQIWWLDVESGERRLVVEGNRPSYLGTGHLLFGTADGTLVAAPFDPRTGDMTGTPIAVVEGLLNDPIRGVVHYDVSETGTLIYRAGATSALGLFEFVWMGREGQVIPVDPGYAFARPGANYGWRLSPDETRIVFNSLMDGQEDVRIKHLPDGPEERISFTEEGDIGAFWGPGGESVAYLTGPVEDRNVTTRRADGTGEPVVLVDDERTYAQGVWSADGSWLLLRTGATAATGLGFRDIVAFRPGIDTVPRPLVATADFAEADPALSVDGRWLAYTSNETGGYEIYVRPFPDVGSSRVRVSNGGGISPRWSGDGRELFFPSPAGMMSAGFDPESGEVGEVALLFEIPPEVSVSTSANFYDVTADGQRFLMARPLGSELANRMIVVQGFLTELMERVGG